MQYYGFTVKNNRSKCYPTYEDYEDWMHNAISLGFDIQSVGWELDKKRRLHVHGIALASPRLTYLKLMFRRYHQFIEPIPSNNDLVRWSDYCKKDYDDRYLIEQEVITQGIRDKYSFI